VDLPGTRYALFVAGHSSDRDRAAFENDLTLLEQVHGCRVLVDPQRGETGDAIVMTSSGGRPAVRVADCLPVAAVTTEAVGIAHAGWRGLASGVLEEFLSVLPGRLLAIVIGPCICGSCYEVGEEVLAALGEEGERRSDRDGLCVDLRGAARRRMTSWGVTPDLVWQIEGCTHHTMDEEGPLFHSYRRDGEESGRNLVWISGV
jgi:copper oxidase (laccase) domain-containing protein